jgi:RNA polymerase sigma-70 factor (ECF subfamily)
MTQKDDEQKATLTLAHKDFQKGLNSYASFKVNNYALSEELVQDTFIKTWPYLVKGGEILKMKAFLYHVLNGLIIDEYRKRKVSSLDVLIENGYEPAFEEEAKVADAFDGKIAVSLIAQLPKAYQKVMRMRYVQELSLAEMAVITGKSKNTMAVHAHRGLEKLKELYFKQENSN